MPKVSDEQWTETRQRLVDAARTVIMKLGPESATTRAILHEAGMAIGSLYTYFASKEALFETVAEQVIGENVVLALASSDPEHPRDRALRFLDDLLLEPVPSPALVYFRGRLSSDADVRDAIARFNRYVVQTFAPLVSDAVDAGAFPPDTDVDAMTELFDVIVDGLNRRHVTGTFVTSFERVGAAARQLADQATRSNES